MSKSLYARLEQLVALARENPSQSPDTVIAWMWAGADQYAGMTLVRLRLASVHATEWRGWALLDAVDWRHFRRVYIDGGGLFELGDIFGKHTDVHCAWNEFDATKVTTEPARIALARQRGMRGDELEGGEDGCGDGPIHYYRDELWERERDAAAAAHVDKATKND